LRARHGPRAYVPSTPRRPRTGTARREIRRPRLKPYRTVIAYRNRFTPRCAAADVPAVRFARSVGTPGRAAIA
jgi:hypothetical protein